MGYPIVGVSKFEICHLMQFGVSITFICQFSALFVGSRIVAVHWLLESIRQYKLLTPVFYIIAVTPVVIEGHNVSNEFVDFEPPWT